MFTTEKALHSFFENITKTDAVYLDQPKAKPPKRPDSKQRKRSIERANKVLVEAGIAEA